MRALFLALLILPGSVLAGGIPWPTGSFNPTKGTKQFHLNDDIPLSLGGTAANPNAKLLWNTAGTDQLQIWLTDIDGIGGDGVALYWLTGTDDAVMNGGLTLNDTLSLSDGNITNVGDIALDSLTAEATSGGITIGGTGATSAESLKFQFGETANIVNVTTATGVLTVDWAALGLTTTGTVTTGSLTLAAAGTLQFAGSTKMNTCATPVDGHLCLTNAAGQGVRLDVTTNDDLVITSENGDPLDLFVNAVRVLSGTALTGTSLNFGGASAQVATADRGGGTASPSLTVKTGDQVNAGDVASGTLTYCHTGDTTTDGDPGACIARTGVAGAGRADANGHEWYVHGTELAMSIDGPTGDTTFTNKTRNTVDADTIADSGDGNPAPHTLEATSKNVQLTCNDVHTCDVTMGETNAVDGDTLIIVNVSTNVCDFADTGGVSELTGAFAMGQWDTLTLEYVVDRYVEQSRSNN